MVYTTKWGILATGGIASTFVKDLNEDPANRGVSDVEHEVVAVGSHSGIEKAREFIKEHNLEGAVAYGDYQELVNDPNVQVLYIATPHSHHYRNAKLALNAGKHVLLEKPFTINVEQADKLIALAKEKNLFLMEAVWTRFFPITRALKRVLHQDRVLGKLYDIRIDFGVYFPKDNDKSRMLNPHLAGGSLLDLGPYAILWSLVTLHEDPDNDQTKIPDITATALKTVSTGVDEFTTVVLKYEKLHAISVSSANMSAPTPEHEFAVIRGEKGYISLHGPAFRPRGFTVHLTKALEDGNQVITPVEAEKGTGQTETIIEYKFDIPGRGMFYEADAVARDLRDGKKQNDLVPWSTTLTSTKIYETVLKQIGLTYPPEVEAAD